MKFSSFQEASNHAELFAENLGVTAKIEECENGWVVTFSTRMQYLAEREKYYRALSDEQLDEVWDNRVNQNLKSDEITLLGQILISVKDIPKNYRDYFIACEKCGNLVAACTCRIRRHKWMEEPARKQCDRKFIEQNIRKEKETLRESEKQLANEKKRRSHVKEQEKNYRLLSMDQLLELWSDQQKNKLNHAERDCLRGFFLQAREKYYRSLPKEELHELWNKGDNGLDRDEKVILQKIMREINGISPYSDEIGRPFR